MAPPNQSAIWAFFKQDEHDRERAQCTICFKTYSRKGRTTTSLRNHLKSMHQEVYNLCSSSEVDKKCQEKKYESYKSVTPLQGAKSQLSFDEVFQRETKLNVNHPNSKKIDNLIGEMIVLQNIPFNFIDGIGFRRLMQEVAPTYNLRGCNYFTDYVCNELYENVAEKVAELIQQFDYMSFTTDIWTDPCSNASLLSLTCHGITENFDRSAIVLKCETFDDRQTGDIIAEKFDTMLTEWNITHEKVHCMIRDEGSNMERAMRLGVVNDLDCTIHKMQQAIRRGLETQQNIKEVKQKCKQILTYFNQSTIAQKQLQKIQDGLNQPHLKVFQDCVTRWNSTYYMFDWFLKAKDALILCINDSEMDPIMPEDWKIIECCAQLLKPFEEATREFSSSEALISSVIPITQMLIKKLDDHLTGSQDPGPIRVAVTTLKTEMSSKFSALDESHLFSVATYLDPRFKHKFFKPLTEERIKEEILRDQNNRLHDNDSTWSPHPNYNQYKRLKMEDSLDFEELIDNFSEQPSTSATARKPCLKSDLESMLDSSNEDDDLIQRPDSPGTDLKKELASYRSKKRINVSENPLIWWKDNKEFKMLSAMARRYLSPPPASVSSGQLFSGAGLIHEPCLDPENAAKLLFIKYNAPIFMFKS